MSCLDELNDILRTTLALPSFSAEPSTPLLGALPELDSMSVASVIAAIECQFHIQIEDDEISARHFETLGSLAAFVQRKLAD
jgi:acyl carrier protein